MFPSGILCLYGKLKITVIDRTSNGWSRPGSESESSSFPKIQPINNQPQLEAQEIKSEPNTRIRSDDVHFIRELKKL